MINDELKTLKHYNTNKRKFNKNYNYIWKKIAGPFYVGSCSYLFQEFYKEWLGSHDEIPSPEDFAKYYFSHTNPEADVGIYKKNCEKYGRSVDDLRILAEEYQKRCNNYNIPLEDYFDDIVNHVIVETTIGQIREIRLIREYESKGFTVEHTNGYWDKDLGVDFIIRKDGVIRDYIQCKPLTTFMGNNNVSLVEDRKNFFHKEIAKKQECEKCNMPYYPTKFILYGFDEPDKWCYIGEKRGFLLEELTDTNGLSIIEGDKIHYK